MEGGEGGKSKHERRIRGRGRASGGQDARTAQNAEQRRGADGQNNWKQGDIAHEGGGTRARAGIRRAECACAWRWARGTAGRR